jgi:hypothetical protein
MFLLDANAFMEASRLYYTFDVVPGFWAWLSNDDLTGEVASIEAVRDEITAGTGELVGWAGSLPGGFWLPDTTESVIAMAELAAWATDASRQYRQEAVDEFLDSADLKLVAHGMVSGAVVVTRERPAPESRKKVKIPDACNAFGVSWQDPFSAYRSLGLHLEG